MREFLAWILSSIINPDRLGQYTDNQGTFVIISKNWRQVKSFEPDDIWKTVYELEDYITVSPFDLDLPTIKNLLKKAVVIYKGPIILVFNLLVVFALISWLISAAFTPSTILNIAISASAFVTVIEVARRLILLSLGNPYVKAGFGCMNLLSISIMDLATTALAFTSVPTLATLIGAIIVGTYLEFKFRHYWPLHSTTRSIMALVLHVSPIVAFVLAHYPG